MKVSLQFIICLFSFSSIAQVSITPFEFNNTNAMISNSGFLFENSSINNHGYEVPKGGGNHAIYGVSMWMMGKTSEGYFKGSVGTYSSEIDLFPGPIADNYLDPNYNLLYAGSIWSITKAQIDYHIANYNQVGYVADAAIINWPGNGNTSNGIAMRLAPFADVNSNNLYEPLLGDYPLIYGDAAVFTIMNDEKNVHATGTEPIGLELHVMAYQFASADHLNNTTFFNVKLYNRRAFNMNDFVFGLFTDFDLGNYNDDYMGSDSVNNMLYVYNSDNLDDGGYGTNPPAVGIMSLNQDLGATRMFTSTMDKTGIPNTTIEKYWCLNGRFRDGSSVMNDGALGTTTGPVTTFQYSSYPTDAGGWSENTAGNLGGDKRGLLAMQPTNFNSGAILCYNFAVIYSDFGLTHFEQAESLQTVAAEIKAHYDALNFSCEINTVGISDEDNSVPFSVYPNPTSGQITVSFNQSMSAENVVISVKNIVGQEVYSHTSFSNGTTTFDVSDLPSGLYIIVITANNKQWERKLIKN